MNRRNFTEALASTMALGLIPQLANATGDYPTKPIRTIVPTSSGGATDAVARLYGELIGKLLNQPLVIDNVPGAVTLIGTRQVAKSNPDGYTLGIMANTVTTLPYINKSGSYSSGDLTGVSYLARSHMMLVVGAQSPYKTLNDLVAAAKKDPDGVTYASVGEGTTSHLPVELFARHANIKLMMILYKGITYAAPDVISGRVSAMMGTKPSVGELIKAGKVRALAVTSERRLPSMPDVPTFTELGYGDVVYELFLGLMAPSKTPTNIIRTLSAAFEAVKKQPDFAKRLEMLDQEMPTQSTPEQFNAFLRKEEERMKPLLQKTRSS